MKTGIRKETVRHPLSASFAPASAWAALLFCVILGQAISAHALGVRIPNQDPEAIARGNAFVATADNPSALYYNPAGITQLEGRNVQFGLHTISINSFYEAPGGSPKTSSDFEVQGAPQFYYTQQIKKTPLTFGLGMFAPYGLGIKWPDDGPFRTAGIEGRLMYVTINPVIAWKVNEKLSLAAGPTINYSQVLLTRGLGAAPSTAEFKFKGDGWDFGYTLGVRYQINDNWAVGAKYQSGTEIDFSGSAAVTGLGRTDSSAKIPFAQYATTGVSYRPDTNWNIEVNFEWTDWHSLQTVTFENTPVGNVPQPFNWNTSFMAGIGATRQLNNGYFVSAGYFFSQNSTSDANFSPLIPDTDLHVGSAGIGHHGEHWSWMFAAQLITGPDRVVTGNVDPSANGSYHWLNGALNFSVGYHF